MPPATPETISFHGRNDRDRDEAGRAGFRIREVPIGMRERDAGKSSIRWSDSLLYMFQVIIAILLTATKKPAPREGSP